MDGMKKIKLGDVLDVRRGTSLSGEYYAESGTYIRLTLGNFNYPNGGFKENTSKKDIYYIGNINPQFILKKGDIITPLTEQVSGLLGETARIPEDNLYLQSGDVGLIIPDEDKIDKTFAYYLVSSPCVKKQLGAAAQQTKIRHTSPENIKNCEVWIPNDIEIGKKIGELLDGINEKISLNNKLISELESLAKTIYDYWFLQFEFPNEDGKPYKSSGGKMIWSEELKREIPEGWGIEEIGKHITVKRGISYNTSDLNDAGIPMLNLNSINPDYSYKVSGLKRYVGTYKAENILQPHDLVVAVTQQTSIDLVSDTDVIGKGVLVPDIFDGNVVFSMDIIKLVTDEKLDKYYLNMLFKQYFYRRYITGFANGTKIKHLDINGILDFKFIIPENSILMKYSAFAESCECKKSSLLKENLELTELRDYLLPMLMNGQVGFKE